MEENFNYDFRIPLQRQQDERRKSILSMCADYPGEGTRGDLPNHRIYGNLS